MMTPLIHRNINRLVLLLLIVLNLNSYGQNSLTISSSRSQSLDFTPFHSPGQPPKFLIDDTKWLNYTIIVKPNQPTCSISVQIVSGMIPDGIEIKLKAGNYEGTSSGKPGIPTGEVILSHVPQVLIDNIGTSYTGADSGVGHQLTYSIDVKDFERLQAENGSINLVFTIGQ